MFTFRQPTDDQVRAYLAGQATMPFSYGDVGCTRKDPAPRRGWKIDRARVLLGKGQAAFTAAKQAIQSWRMFPAQLGRVFEPNRVPEPGSVVGILYRVRLVPVWITFPARVVWTVDEAAAASGPLHRFGFGYGTLPDHPERGEERFLVEWNQADDTVWYDLLAISRPGHWLARGGYPYTRWEQARFRRMSCEAMRAAVQ